jgi:hypothetical protein
MEICDVALFAGGPHWEVGDPFPEAQHFDEPVFLGKEVWLGPLTHVAEDIMDACSLRGKNTPIPTRQYSSRYGFYRSGVTTDNYLKWDADTRLRTAIALSRLVRPTSIGYQYAAQVVRRKAEDEVEIVPGWGYSNVAGHVLDEKQNWIRDQDVPQICTLIEAFDPAVLPSRITRAMWYYEYGAWEYFIDVRWVLTVTALEALVHTDDRGIRPRLGSTAQFVQRLLALQARLGKQLYSQTDLEEIYERRSGLAHGRGFQGSSLTDVTPSYLIADRSVREILVTAIENTSIARLFESDHAVRNL